MITREQMRDISQSVRALVDKQLLSFTDAMPKAELSVDRIPAIRAVIDQIVPPSQTVPDGITAQQLYIPGPAMAPELRVLTWQPIETEATKKPAILYFHGGGYMMGKPEQAYETLGDWAKEFGAVIVAPAYRLTPENPFPAAINDGYAALSWMVSHADNLGIDRNRIAVAGDSAGGGLAASLAHMVRDRGKYSLCFQHLLHPMLDDRTAKRTDIAAHHGAFIWSNEDNAFAWTILLGSEPGGNSTSAYASAARADNFAGLPPAFISVGDLDLFLEEDLAYAAALSRAAVPVAVQVLPGAPHAFSLVKDADVAQQYRRVTSQTFRKAFGLQ
jgi:acetyl esterase/lipase